MHGYSRCVNYYFINFFSHLCALQSLSSTLFNLSSLTYSQHCLTTTQSPPPQPIITHDIPITKSTKNKEKSNQTQNQTFNGKLNNLEPKIKFQQKTHQHKPKLKLKLLSPLHGELAATIKEEWNKCLRAKTKEKIQKKKWREKTMEVERRCDFVR